MYQYFIYFIVTLIIYSTFQPIQLQTASIWTSLSGQACLMAGFALLCRGIYGGLERALLLGRLLPSEIQKRYFAWNTRLSIIAIVFFALNLYVFNLKYYILKIGFIKDFESLSAIAGLSVFVLYLVVQWLSAYSLARRFSASDVSRGRFVGNRLRLSLSVLFPWFVITILFDLVDLSPFPFLKTLSPITRELILFGSFLGVIVLFAPLSMKVFWGLKSLPRGPYRAAIEDACKKLHFTYRDIVLWPIFEGEVITAGVMGLVGRFRYLMITKALLEILNPGELEAVIGHEVGHTRKHHMVFYLVFLLGYLVIIYPAFDLIYLLTLSSDTIHDLISLAPDYQITLLSIIMTLPVLILFILYFRFIFGYFMRNFERQADFFSLRVMGDSEPLVGALEKIGYHSGNIRDVPSWHHFSIAQRVSILRKGEKDPGVLTRHDKKLRRYLIVYLAAVFALGYSGYALTSSNITKQSNVRVIKKILMRQAEKRPLSTQEAAVLATINYEEGEYREAEAGFRRVLMAEPNNVEIINNLAWLYATCPDRSLRHPDDALRLARRAVELEPSPHIMDTLAESYYVNSMFAEAAAVEKKAIALKPQNLEYYKKQLEKFETAARTGRMQPEEGNGGQRGE
jgi:Zn-dependent protease with chaperone function